MTLKFSALVLTAALATSLTGCSGRESESAAAEPAVAAEAAAADVSAAAPDAAAPAQAAAPGAPAFAVLYPGATPKGPPVQAESPAGPGGIVEFTTEATPDAVVAFYARHAEAAGLSQISSMSQAGGAGYSAGDGADGRGQLLSVIATPVGETTDVQLSWSAGR